MYVSKGKGGILNM